MSDSTPPPKKKTKLTARTRRGLADIRALLIQSFDDNAPPCSATLAKFTKQRQGDINQALAWIEENEIDRAALALEPTTARTPQPESE